MDRLQNRTFDANLASYEHPFIYYICVDIGDREKVCGDVLRGVLIFLRLNPIFRSDAVVVYDNPSEGA